MHPEVQLDEYGLPADEDDPEPTEASLDWMDLPEMADEVDWDDMTMEEQGTEIALSMLDRLYSGDL